MKKRKGLQSISISDIHLVRQGEFAIVLVDINGKIIEVIREFYDSNFYHCVTANGIACCYNNQEDWYKDNLK